MNIRHGFFFWIYQRYHWFKWTGTNRLGADLSGMSPGSPLEPHTLFDGGNNF